MSDLPIRVQNAGTVQLPGCSVVSGVVASLVLAGCSTLAYSLFLISAYGPAVIRYADPENAGMQSGGRAEDDPPFEI